MLPRAVIDAPAAGPSIGSPGPDCQRDREVAAPYELPIAVVSQSQSRLGICDWEARRS